MPIKKNDAKYSIFVNCLSERLTQKNRYFMFIIALAILSRLLSASSASDRLEFNAIKDLMRLNITGEFCS
jgi:hypothetical protein